MVTADLDGADLDGTELDGAELDGTELDGSRDAALAWATAARDARHRVRRELRSGATTLGGLLDLAGVDELIGQVRLLWALESLPGARKTDTRRVLDRLGLDGGRLLGTLSAAELDTVLATFPLDPAAQR